MAQEKSLNHINTKIAIITIKISHNLVMNGEVQITGNRMEKGKKSRLSGNTKITLQSTAMNLSLLTSASDYIILNVVYYIFVTRKLTQFEPLTFSSLKSDGEFLHSLTLICFYQSQN